MLRPLAILAAFVALAALGLAIGDFADDPNPLGAIGLIVISVAIFMAMWQLFGTGGVAALRRGASRARPARAPGEPARPTPTPKPAAKRRQPRTRPTSAPLWLDDDEG